jgi:transcription antitermination factor NusG
MSDSEKEVNFDWYLVKTYPGKEALAVEFIKDIAEKDGCDSDIEDFFVPKFDDKNKKDSEYASVMMGYFAMKLKLSSELRKVIDKVELAKVYLSQKRYDEKGNLIRPRNNINHKITFFINKKMSKEDVDRMIDSSRVYNEIKNVYHQSEKVIITEGPLKNLNGTIKKIYDGDKLCIDVQIFGRTISVELDASKVKKDNG